MNEIPPCNDLLNEENTIAVVRDLPDIPKSTQVYGTLSDDGDQPRYNDECLEGVRPHHCTEPTLIKIPSYIVCS